MEAYNATWFSPPAPLARVTLRSLARDKVALGVPMLVDSGADVTAVPRTVIATLQDEPLASKLYEITGLAGQSSWLSTVQLELIFEKQVFRGQFLIVEQEWGIIGRNMLNEISVFLNGPFMSWRTVK